MSLAQPSPGVVIWLTGRPASGKTTLALTAQKLLAARGVHAHLLDSDDWRRVLTPQPKYTAEERDWFYATLAAIAALLAQNGVNVLLAATGPLRRYRDELRARVARFVEVHVACDLEAARQRDPKGLYARADRGEITSLPGVGAPYEPPLQPELVVRTQQESAEEGAGRLVEWLEATGLLP